jgi:hypothetical protein
MQTENRKQEAIKLIQEMAEKWPTNIVPRAEIAKFSGGLIASGTLANLDCQGKGIPGAFKIGRQKVYPVQSIITWLVERVEV